MGRLMSHRRAAKIDNNQQEIVKELRQAGFSVSVNHDDILVGYQGRTFWYEIKSDLATSKKTGEVLESKIKDSQKKLRDEWKGHYRIVPSYEYIVDDIFNQLNKEQS